MVLLFDDWDPKDSLSSLFHGSNDLKKKMESYDFNIFCIPTF